MAQAVGVPAKGTAAPLMSIVIATYNVAEMLPDAIESVLAQNRSDVELIVIDGNSTDGTTDIIHHYADRIAYWVSEKDTGIYNAWNKGLRAAKGRYIAFLGADDVLLPGALESYARLIASSPEAEYLSGRVLYGEGEGARVIGLSWDWRRSRRYMTVAHVGSMHRRSLFDRLGPYDESFAITGDYELLLRAGPDLRTAYMTDITVRMGVEGISSGRAKLVFEETARAKRLHAGLSERTITYDRWRAIAGYRLRRFLRM